MPVRPWPTGTPAPRVQIIVPARNEETNIVPLLNSLLRQRYPADRWGITVVDDNSTDRTRELALEIAGRFPHVQVVQAGALPAGWTGKNHAMYTGYQSAPPDADWLLFVDADTRHRPQTLSSAIVRANEVEADLLSLVIRVEMETFWERVLVPQVGELYTLLVGSMDAVNARGKAAAANGQFMLIRRELYSRMAVLPEVHRNVAEDRALAAASKVRGASVRLEYGRTLVKARVYTSLAEMWSGYSKSMYWASGQNWVRTVSVALALALYALVPVLSLLHALVDRRYRWRTAALRHAPLQILPMLALRAVVCREVGIPTYYALCYPLAVAMGDAMLLFSLYRVVSGKGVTWKGRTYTSGRCKPQL